MHITYYRQIFTLLKRLIICYLAYFLSRIIFYFANTGQFPTTGTADLLGDIFYGLRFDSFTIVLSNSLFILLSILPVNFFYRKWYQNILFILFLLCNAVFLAFNFIDVGYYPYTHKRANADLFEQLGGQSDVIKLLPQFARDFWWILILYILTIFIMGWLYRKIKINSGADYRQTTFRQWLLIVMVFIVCVGTGTIAVRGGLQRVPIDVVNAGAVTSPEEVPIVLNTPFTIIKSLNQQPLEEYKFFTEEELATIYKTVHHFKSSKFSKKNVVVLILESFSKEYTRLGNRHGVTPFLDSLMGHSMVFANGFSNGTKSIEGIPAILSGLPSFMENPFINSMYANNLQTSMATVLNDEGYTTAFFHGGINGTMNFTDWAPSAGYQHYFGRDEYMNEDDFDGYWGIWDEPFLQYSIKKMNDFKQPFHTAVFTLSSHHPYFVPSVYKNKFKKGKLENAESIQYADHSLKMFFETAKKTNWYNNTLFVLVADHAGISDHPFYANPVGNLTIPILFYEPGKTLHEMRSEVFCQADILPSTMELLGYPKPFFALGKSYTQPGPGPSFFYASGSFYQYTDSMMYRYNNNNLVTVYNYKRDSSLNVNIVGKHPGLDSAALRFYKAFFQIYNHTLITNSGSLKNGPFK